MLSQVVPWQDPMFPSTANATISYVSSADLYMASQINQELKRARRLSFVALGLGALGVIVGGIALARRR